MIDVALYNHLIDQEEIFRDLLTTYDGLPAIFNQEAPDDQDEKWASGAQYGRIVFAVDMREDPERAASGSLMVDIMCKKGFPSPPPEEIEPVVRKLIDGYFFPTENQGVMATQWKTSNSFSVPDQQIAGVTIVFSILAFPLQSTCTDPEPIFLLNEWTKDLYANSYVIGHDSLPIEAWKPSDACPAIYWRVVQTSKCSWIPDTYAVSWRTAVLKCHIMAPSYHEVSNILTDMSYRLSLAKRLPFKDGSPLFTDRNIQTQPGADPLRTGQLTIEGTFGILTPIEQGLPLKSIGRNYDIK